MKSVVLVLMQFTCLGILVTKLGGISEIKWILGFQIALLILAAWSFFEFRNSRFSIFPKPLARAGLLTSGPYKYIRHPMYTVVFFYFLPDVFMSLNWFIGHVWLVLVGVIISKLLFEERLLQKKYPEYSEYMQKTKKMLPWVY